MMEIIINAGNITGSTETHYMEEKLCINGVPHKISIIGWNPYVDARIKSVLAVTGMDIRSGTFDIVREMLETEHYDVRIYSVTVTTFRLTVNGSQKVEVFASFSWGQLVVSADGGDMATKIRDEFIKVANISDENEPELKLMKIAGELIKNIHGISIQSLEVGVGQEEEVEF